MTAGLVVVTGAAAGIGACLAERLVAAGRCVIGLDRVAAMPQGVRGVVCDLASRAGVRAAAEAVRQIAGGRDGAAGIAGLAHVAGAPGTLDAGTVVAVNFLAVRELAAALADDFAPGAALVAVSSLAAQRCDWTPQRLSEVVDEADWDAALARVLAHAPEGGPAYEASKRLLIHWVPAAVAALAAKRVRVNTVSPGPVQTQMLASFRASMGAQRIDAAERLAGRHAEPDEIAAAIQFLLGPDASWISGVDLRADGGLQALRDWQGRSSPTKARP